jgi:hypothetical protein
MFMFATVSFAEVTVAPNANPTAPLAAVLTFTPPASGETVVRISDGTHTHALRFDASRDPRKGLPLVGMRPDREHRIEVRMRQADGGESVLAEGIRYTTPPLPTTPGAFPTLRVVQAQPDRMEPGYTLLNPRRTLPRTTAQGTEAERRFGAEFGMLLLLDAEGTPVWYYESPSRISDFDYLGNGHFLYVTEDYRTVEIDALGNVVRSWYAAKRPQGPTEATPVDTMTFHHDVDLLPSGNLLALSTDRRQLPDYYTSEYDADAPRATQWVMGDLVVEFTPEGEIVWEWNAFDHLPAYRIGYETFQPYWQRRGYPDTIDWSHANAVSYHPEDNSVLVNFRLLSAIVKIDRASGEIRWIFGEPTGWPESLQSKLITLEGNARWFWHQHAPVLTKRGTLLLFDNGNYRAHPFTPPAKLEETWSRAAEYAIDEKSLTAREVWSSDTAGDDRVVTFAMGSASEMPETGNVFAGYGAILGPEGLEESSWETRFTLPQWTRAREYARTNPTQVLWELHLERDDAAPEIGWNVFGVRRIADFQP